MISNNTEEAMDSNEPSIRISHSSRIIAKVVPNFLQRAFSDPALENLYQSYRVKQKRVDILCFLYASILFDVYALSAWVHVVGNAGVPPGATDIALPLILALLTLVNAALLLVLSLSPTQRLVKVMEVVWTVAPHVAWHAATGQLIATLLLAKHAYVTPRELLGWVLILDYLIYVTLPLRLRYCLILSLATCVSYLTVVGCLGHREEHLGQQVAANCALLFATNVLGLTSYFLSDKQQRRAFLETRQSLEVKLLIEEQSAEQERLLLSVLPEHVAVKMRQDLGEAIDSQFKKIYMSRHENVSILYADIVGFTAISSTYSASELVKILNELFARFDRLAEKYQQLRIKILGDCYYCISGAPQERPDHAILCVHMGLSMVKAIKYVQNTTNSPVDMRVGIHTGAVLAGVLGQRQWQFDVYSKDVELANKMESSGMKGRVHISERTLGYLDGHFEVEPAQGEKREEALRLAGIKTFFIVRALKPFEENTTETRNGGTDYNTEETTANGDSCNKEDSMTIQVYSETRVRENSQDFKRRLRQDLLSRDGHRDVARHIHMLGLGFTDSTKEKAYHSHKASFPAASTIGCPLAALALWLAQTAVLPWHVVNYVAFALGLVLLTGFATIAVADIFSNKFPTILVKWSAKLNGTLWIRTVAGALAILILTILNVINMAFCSVRAYENCTLQERVNPDSISLLAQQWEDEIEDVISPSPSPTLCPLVACLYPSYYTPFAVLILVVTSLVALLSHTAKLAIMCGVVALQIGMNFGPLKQRITCERLATYTPHDVRPIPDDVALTCLLIAVVIALHFLNRHVEKASRVLYVWRMEVEEQRERAADMRRRNESLVYNILPPHVAAHFLKPGAPRRHDELYSQSYAEVGVLFASMPNFSDFYTEETVNNQGLECLRFLNEVISDYDALLERPEFQDIIKIKTIGSTYMAASGLKPKGDSEEDNKVVGSPGPKRWAHLALLVEFAFELKRALTSINEQSFNHFVLKMGINHGPITAGVIGARKPHYDIWGNSVNVASRMESTGKAGCIQVTEETCGILRPFGYQFEQRGLVSVKGKGQLMTYYLIGKGEPPSHEDTSLSTEQISADIGDDDIGGFRSEISGNSATQLLASSAD